VLLHSLNPPAWRRTVSSLQELVLVLDSYHTGVIILAPGTALLVTIPKDIILILPGKLARDKRAQHNESTT
jgi:hypothetical protein